MWKGSCSDKFCDVETDLKQGPKELHNALKQQNQNQGGLCTAQI